MGETIGRIMIIVGLGGLAYGGISYTAKEMTVDRGRTDFSRGNGQNTQLPPIAGGLALLGGIGLVVTSKS